jgi:hypothetical protein
MPSVKTADFISSSAAYVRATAKKANADKNAYLTKTEAKALPKDLQDNYEHHRVGGQANARVTVSKFEQKYTDYVAVYASRADRNADGYISPSEVKNLPRDLQDNYWAFRNR